MNSPLIIISGDCLQYNNKQNNLSVFRVFSLNFNGLEQQTIFGCICLTPYHTKIHFDIFATHDLS